MRRTVPNSTVKPQLRTPKPRVRVSAQAEEAIRKAGLRPWAEKARNVQRERSAAVVGERSGPARAGGKSAGRQRRPADAAAGGALANNAEGSTRQRDDEVQRLWRAQQKVWAICENKRVRKCRKVARLPGGMVAVKVSEHGVGFGGLCTCGSPWVCPMDSRKIAMERAAEVAQAIEWIEARGGMALHVVLTAWHHLGMRLQECWDGTTSGWSTVTKGNGWVKDMRDFGIVGWLKVVETDWGQINGWHNHVHALVLLDRPVSQDTADALGRRLWQRWDKGLGKVGMHSIETSVDGDAVGVSVTRATDRQHIKALGGYFSKMAFEVTHGNQSKRHIGSGNRSPMEILGDLVDAVDPVTGEITAAGYDADDYARDERLYREFEAVSHRRQQMNWSRGLKQQVGIGEKTDDQIAEEDAGGEVIALLPTETWAVVKWMPWQLIRAIENYGLRGLHRWLTRHQLDYEEPIQPASEST